MKRLFLMDKICILLKNITLFAYKIKRTIPVDPEFITRHLKEIEHLSLASIFGVINALIRPAKDSVWYYFIEFIISVSVATLIGFICSDIGLSSSVSFSLVAISALLARDLLTLIIGFGDYVTEHKETLFSKLFNAGINKLSGKDAKDGREKE